jgi:hypothetical protein
MFTDGLEALLLNTGSDCGASRLIDTAWCRTLNCETLETRFHEVETMLGSLSPGDWPADDVTILALEGID